jgi:hypothetical protein
MSKTTVIFHNADFDGIFCREIARKFLPDAELIGWDYGQPQYLCPRDGMVYVMDLPFFNGPLKSASGGDYQIPVAAFDDGQEFRNRVVWIDHHKSAIESHPKHIPGYRIDGVAACRLAWQWFTNADNRPCTCEGGPHSEGHYDHCLKKVLPNKEEFVCRKVTEPLAILLAGEYDVWDCRPCNTEIGLSLGNVK